jgi:hypothetical protein
MPCSSWRRLPVDATSSVSSWFAILIFLCNESVDQFGGQPAACLTDDVTRPHGVEQCPGLLGGQEFLRSAGDQLE